MADYSVTSESENLRLQMRRMMDGLHVAMPAKVLAFQPGPPVRVTVQPTTQMKITLGEEVRYRSLPQLSGARRTAVRADGGLSADRTHPAGGHRITRDP